MCSTPRSSGSARKRHSIPSRKAYFKSYSQMMHKASDSYERKQQERARQHKNLAQQASAIEMPSLPKKRDIAKSLKRTERNISETGVLNRINSVEKNALTDKNSWKQRLHNWISLFWAIIPPIVTT